jgi:hypothetical protein
MGTGRASLRREADHSPHLAQKLRMMGAVPPYQHTPSSRAQEQLYFISKSLGLVIIFVRKAGQYIGLKRAKIKLTDDFSKFKGNRVSSLRDKTQQMVAQSLTIMSSFHASHAQIIQ